MQLFGLDYAWGTISPAAHRAAGSHFACKYLSHDSGKNFSRGEMAELHRGGIATVAVWETTANRTLDGYNAGVQDAREARAQARAVGMLGDCRYYAVDFDASGREGATDGYFDGVASVIGHDCGPYGGLAVVRHQLNRGFRRAWQTYAWSGGTWDPRAQLRQWSNDHTVAGVGCDFDYAVAVDYGQEPSPHPAPPPDPHHYDRFYVGPFKTGNLWLNERATVKELDWQVRRPHGGDRARVAVLRHHVRMLRDRCKDQAVLHGTPQHPAWNDFWRGWRWQELDRRLTPRKPPPKHSVFHRKPAPAPMRRTVYPAGGWLAPGAALQRQRSDHGQDFATNWRGIIQAPGDGYCVDNHSDAAFPNGFGPHYATVMIETGAFASKNPWYLGHCTSLVSPGERFRFGHPLSRADQGRPSDIGLAGSGGWCELGQQQPDGRMGVDQPGGHWFTALLWTPLVVSTGR